MNAETLEPQALTPTIVVNNSLSTQLVAMGITRAMIDEKAAEYNGITIAGPDDKEGEKLALKARRTLVDTRTSINKKRIELNEDALLTQRTNNALAKELTILIEEIEKPLDAKIKAVEAEREAIKAQRLADEAAKFTTRVNSLFKIGAVPEGTAYNVFGVVIDAIEAKALPDDEWSELYDSAVAAYYNEEARLIDVQKAEQLEKERLAAEHAERELKLKQDQDAEKERLAVIAQQQEAEREQLRVEQEALNLQRQEQENRQRFHEQEQARIARQQQEAAQKQQDELNKLILDARVSRLEGLGFIRHTKTISLAGKYFFISDLETMTSEVFEQIIASHCKWIAEQKEAEELAHKRTLLLDSRQRMLIDVGFSKDNNTGTVYFNNSDWHFTEDQLFAFTDEDVAQCIESANKMTEKRAKDEAQAIVDQKAAEAAKKAADKARITRLKSDKAKILKYITTVGNTPGLVVTQPETLDLHIDFEKALKVLINEFTSKLEAL